MSNTIHIQQIQEQQLTLEEAKSLTILFQGEAYTYYDEGLSRFVFVNKDKTQVVKLQFLESAKWNEEENNIYLNSSLDDKKYLAKTELVDGFIVQEFCEPQKFRKTPLSIPEMLFANSCRGEVGWNKEGRLVCFDLDEYKKW